jgi:hypothetical protein
LAVGEEMLCGGVVGVISESVVVEVILSLDITVPFEH